MSVEISHREALSLISEAELVALKVKADAPGLIRIVIHVGAMALTGSAILSTDSPFLLAPLVVAHGIGLVFLFAPLHETIHDTAFRTPALNRVVGLLAGFLLVLPPLYFRYFHFAHHRHTQDPAHDPELATERPAAWLPYLWRLTGYDYWKAEIAMLLRLGFGSSVDGFIPARAQAKVVGEARGFLAAYAVVARRHHAVVHRIACVDLPAEQVGVELLRFRGVLSRDLEPADRVSLHHDVTPF